MPDIWGVASIATKFSLYIGVLTSMGTVLTALIFRLDDHRRSALGYAVLGLIAAVLGFAIGGAKLTGTLGGMTDVEMLSLLWSTPVGTALAYRVTGLAILIAGLFMGPRGLWVSIIGGTLALWSFLQIGHIQSRDNILLMLVLLFHLMAASLWIGILSPLKNRALDISKIQETAQLGHQFGQIASVIVPLMIIAGGYMSYILVGTFSTLFQSGYGQTLIFKIIFVTGLLVLATANKLRFIPAMKLGDR